MRLVYPRFATGALLPANILSWPRVWLKLAFPHVTVGIFLQKSRVVVVTLWSYLRDLIAGIVRLVGGVFVRLLAGFDVLHLRVVHLCTLMEVRVVCHWQDWGLLSVWMIILEQWCLRLLGHDYVLMIEYFEFRLRALCQSWSTCFMINGHDCFYSWDWLLIREAGVIWDKLGRGSGLVLRIALFWRLFKRLYDFDSTHLPIEGVLVFTLDNNGFRLWHRDRPYSVGCIGLLLNQRRVGCRYTLGLD